MDSTERVRRYKDYVEALEIERHKIQVFQRELPFCLQLVTQTIESVKQQMEREDVQSDDGPVLEEFIPLKPSLSSTSEEESELHEAKERESSSDRKPDWLQSVQLWNQHPDPTSLVEPSRKLIAVNPKKIGGAFLPFKSEKQVLLPLSSVTPQISSSITSGSGEKEEKENHEENENENENEKEKEGLSLQSHRKVSIEKENQEENENENENEKEKEGLSLQSHRKVRRCWSQELHRRFLDALRQLGGSQVATPKQIREVMKVDGLTNDEVKSHLQKYRLHTRRPSAGMQSSSTTSQQPAPQFVVVGGIWVPSPDYAAAVVSAAAAAQPANTSASASGVYAPVATQPPELRFPQQQQQQKQQQNRRSSNRSPTGPLDDNMSADGEDATNSASPTNSSSSQTTTASPPL